MSQKAFAKFMISAVIVVAQILSLTLLSLAQSGAFTFTPVVRRGDPVVDRGRFFDCKDCEGGIAGSRAFNNMGEAVVWGESTGSCSGGRYIAFNRQGIRLVDSCNATPFGNFNTFGSVAINDYTQVAFDAGISTATSSVTGTYLYSGGEITKIAAPGDPSPIGPIAIVGGPSINSKGEVAFTILSGSITSSANSSGVFVYSGETIRKLVSSGDPSPIGGTFFDVGAIRIQENGDVLFWARVETTPYWKSGLFLATQQGVKKIMAQDDVLPDVGASADAPTNLYPRGDLNSFGEVAFVTMLSGRRSGEPADTGIFLRSGDSISKIVAAGDRTPIGGNFSSFRPKTDWVPLPDVHLSIFSTVAFFAEVNDGSSNEGIFLASSRAMVKVVAIGDVLANGDRVGGFRPLNFPRYVPAIALNDQGEIAFPAYNEKGVFLGIFRAAAVTPVIKSVKLKRKRGVMELRVTGTGFIANDAEIRINGVSLGELSYPDAFQQDGGTTARVVSRDRRLGELLPPGETVEVRVHNPLTVKLSEPVTLTR